jgi:hypothetical protein
MSQENVELARQAYDTLNRRDSGALLALMDADVEALPRMVALSRPRWNPTLVGTPVDFLPDLVIETVAVRDLSDLTLAAVHIRGHGAGSYTPLAETLSTPAEWRDGKCVSWANHGTEAEALQAVGLRA